jgi:hypothetical protein
MFLDKIHKNQFYQLKKGPYYRIQFVILGLHFLTPKSKPHANFTKFHRTVIELFQVKDEILREKIPILQITKNRAYAIILSARTFKENPFEPP